VYGVTRVRFSGQWRSGSRRSGGAGTGPFQLALDDADQAVQVAGGDVGHGPLERHRHPLRQPAPVRLPPRRQRRRRTLRRAGTMTGRTHHPLDKITRLPTMRCRWVAGSQRARYTEQLVLALSFRVPPSWTASHRCGDARLGAMVSLLPARPAACRDRGRGRALRRQPRAGRDSGSSRWHARAAGRMAGRGARVRRGCRRGRR
jgi:hypothetical protein